MVTLGSVLFMATIAAIAFFGTDLEAGLQQIGLARRPDFSAIYRRPDVAPLPPMAAQKADEVRWAAEALSGWVSKTPLRWRKGPSSSERLPIQIEKLPDCLAPTSISHGRSCFAIADVLVAPTQLNKNQI